MTQALYAHMNKKIKIKKKWRCQAQCQACGSDSLGIGTGKPYFNKLTRGSAWHANI
jgi:hypothetical protein